MDLSSARAFLQREGAGGSVYSHLQDVLVQLLKEQPDNALNIFESISSRVKQGAASMIGTSSASTDSAGAGSTGPGAAALVEHEATARARLRTAVTLVTGETEAPTLGEPTQNLPEDAQLLEWAGLSIGRTETFRLYLSLRALAASKPIRGLRFWGKVLGLRGDYLVAEGAMDAADIPGAEGEAEEDKDALGNSVQRSGSPGPNEKVYWVCAAVGDPWTQLPRVTPHQVTAARKLRRFLTGELGAPVGGHPPFPGSEAGLLRATIALITAATALAPAGAFSVPEDGSEDGGIAPNVEEWAAPELGDVSGWVHTSLELNAQGRSKPNPPAIDPATGEEAPPPDDAPAPAVPLKPASEDSWPPAGASGEGAAGDYALTGSEDAPTSAWDVRVVPTAGLGATPEPGADPWSVTVLRSLVYPGAVAVGTGKRYACAYLGYGLPSLPAGASGAAPYQPTLPASLPTEFDYAAAGLAEQREVTVDPDAGKPPAGEGEDAEDA